MSAFVCHRDSLRCSLARSFARLQFEPAEPGSSRGSHARILFRLLIARRCLFFFLTFLVPSACAFISPMIFVFRLSYTPLPLVPSLVLSLSRGREIPFDGLPCVRSSLHVVYLRPESVPRITDLTVWHFANFECDSSRLNSSIDLLNNIYRYTVTRINHSKYCSVCNEFIVIIRLNDAYCAR